MKKIAALLIGLFWCVPVQAAPAPQVHAQGAVVMEAESGRVLWSKNADTPLPMASTTKIMTALLALEEGDLDKIVTISSRAANAPQVRMGLRAGQQYRLGDLLLPLMLESANDAAIAVAEGVSGSVEAFCTRMTERAAALGATDTVFITPNGLDAGDHHSTAMDMALIAREALKNEDFCKLIATRFATIADAAGKNPQTFNNKNRLLWEMEGALGVKTGFTVKAGHCFVGAVEQNGMTLITVVLASGWGNAGKSWKWTDTKALLGYGFDNYARTEVLRAGDALGELPVRMSKGAAVPLRLAEGLTLPLTEDEKTALTLSRELPESLEAPVEAGTTVGTATVWLDGVAMGSVPVETAAAVERRDLEEYFRKLLGKVG